MGPQATILPCGTRLHLQHGPIDLIIGADGDRRAAFDAAQARFATVLHDIMPELGALKRPMAADTPTPSGTIAQRMDHATRPFATLAFVTRMAAVAGSVADTVLHAMTTADITRAYVNNGGDIAVHLTQGQQFSLAMAGHDGADLGRITLHYDAPTRGIATSGRHGRSLSLGVADSVTVLATTAARADVAATLIANAVDLPGHPAITRRPAHDIDDTSDLGGLPVVVGCGVLSDDDTARAVSHGRARADLFMRKNLIAGAAMFLQGHADTTCATRLSIAQRTPEHA
ncbi:UPF0280 family protein [Roseobacter sp.]|uniref:UPF0280 family protein n=1 Tax=Roseobacter sp. TaxID=1907202 RepID=UPI0032986BB8